MRYKIGRKSAVRTALVVLCVRLALAASAEETPFNPLGDGRASLAAELARSANPTQLLPGTNDGRIAYVTASMLQQVHYLHLKFDAKLSSQLLDRYIDTLDPQHLHFLQSDLAEFEPYRNRLDKLTLQKTDTS